MCRLVLHSVLGLFCLGSLCGCGSEEKSAEKKDAHKRTRRVPDPNQVRQ
jgi:hypothetical protein